MGYHEMICRQLEEFGTEVVNAGIVDSPSSARATGDLFKIKQYKDYFSVYFDLCSFINSSARCAAT